MLLFMHRSNIISLANITISVVIVLIVLLADTSSATTAAKRCPLQRDVVYFSFDQTSQSFTPYGEAYNTRLNLTSTGTPSSHEGKNYSGPLYRMRQCSCSPTSGTRSYCMDNSSNYCELSSDSTVVCYYENSSSGFLKNTFTISVLWYGALLIFFMTTDNGKHTRDYLLSIFCPQRNRRIAQRLLDEEIRILDRMQTFGFGRHRRPDSLGLMAYPNQHEELVLKTRVYHSEHSLKRGISTDKNTPGTPATIVSNDSFGVENDADNDHGRSSIFDEECKTHSLSSDASRHQSMFPDGIPHEIRESALMRQVVDTDPSGFFSENHEDDEIMCSICLASVEDGERIGALSCNHIFHSHCLKDWLRRRNVCPLCQAPNVAEVRPNLRTSNVSTDPTPTHLATRRASGLVEWNGSQVVTAFRLQQPSGQVRIIYRLERPAQARTGVSHQERERPLARLFSVLGSNTESTSSVRTSTAHHRSEHDATETGQNGNADVNVRDEEAGSSR